MFHSERKKWEEEVSEMTPQVWDPVPDNNLATLTPYYHGHQIRHLYTPKEPLKKSKALYSRFLADLMFSSPISSWICEYSSPS